MPKSACKWKRMENKTQNAKTKFQKTGSPLKRPLKACKSTGCMKNKLEREIGRSSGRPVYKAPRSSMKYPARADTKVCRKYWEQEIHARAAVSPLEQTSNFRVFPDCVLERNSTFQPHFLHIMAPISHILVLTWYKHQNTSSWSSISCITYMHVSY